MSAVIVFYNIRSVIAIIALLAVSFLIVNNILFVHFHSLGDGNTIVHAHPFNKSSEDNHSREKHKHSDKELLLISFINSVLLQVIFTAFVLYAFFKQLISKTIKPVYLAIITGIIIDKYKARPPPPHACNVLYINK